MTKSMKQVPNTLQVSRLFCLSGAGGKGENRRNILLKAPSYLSREQFAEIIKEVKGEEWSKICAFRGGYSIRENLYQNVIDRLVSADYQFIRVTPIELSLEEVERG